MAMVRMPISWHAAMTRTAISPRLAISTDLNIVAHPRGAPLLQKRADALLPFDADAQTRDGRRRRLARLDGIQRGDGERHELGGPHARWPVLPDLAQRRGHCLIELVGGHDAVHQPNGKRTCGVEALGGDEEGA